MAADRSQRSVRTRRCRDHTACATGGDSTDRVRAHARVTTWLLSAGDDWNAAGPDASNARRVSRTSLRVSGRSRTRSCRHRVERQKKHQPRLVAAGLRKEIRTSPHQAAGANHLRTLDACRRNARPSRNRLRDLRSEVGHQIRCALLRSRRQKRERARLDAALPDVPFATWLQPLAARYGDEKNDPLHWRIAYCGEFSVEAGLPPRTRDLCTVAYVHLTGGWAEIWLRTGRIELTSSDARWLAEPPSVEGIRLRYSSGS